MSGPEKYPFTKEVEAAVAVATASKPRFYEMLGHTLEPDRMPSRPGHLLVLAAQRAAKKIGGPCPALALAIQELRLLHNEGKVTHEDVLSAVDLGDVADAVGEIDAAALAATAAEAVRHVAYRQVVDDVLKGGKSFTPEMAVEKFERVASIGKSERDDGEGLTGTEEQFIKLAANRVVDPLSTGVEDLDHKLQGGLERRGVGVMLAGTGVMKSMFLCHLAAEAVWNGKGVIYVTLELPVIEVQSRIMRNLVGMTADEVKNNPGEAARRFDMIRGRIGPLRIVYRTPGETSVTSLKSWARDLRREVGISPEVFLIDPVDDLVHRKDDRRKRHEVVNDVFVRLRDMAQEDGLYIWCTSQAVRGKNRGQQLHVDDVADGMGKVRKATLVIGGYRTKEDEENGEVRFCFPKRTAVETTGQVGPLRHDFERGRIAVGTRREEPWVSDTATSASRSSEPSGGPPTSDGTGSATPATGS